jgi:hypothetical protein
VQLLAGERLGRRATGRAQHADDALVRDQRHGDANPAVERAADAAPALGRGADGAVADRDALVVSKGHGEDGPQHRLTGLDLVDGQVVVVHDRGEVIGDPAERAVQRVRGQDARGGVDQRLER